ncbi:MAG: HNH endonuclease signature motif containing protein [Gammaproteobacteria bacterium]|nr:HNH endonuclease signature motif containing protein [Gammaproteobacteria bacterium]MDE0260657.1 HNH endonuclease signature motif containing protein [Gammaproteobacteria bacterium]
MEERDRGCRFPACGCRFTEAHHVKHWADGGETSLGNTVLLCRRARAVSHPVAGIDLTISAGRIPAN